MCLYQNGKREILHRNGNKEFFENVGKGNVEK